MKRHAILFGVDAYGLESGFKSLECPSRDVDLLSDLYSSPQFGGAPERTHVHKNVSHTEAERLLYHFLKDLGREDVAVVHFSGHGMPDDGPGELYLCFTDTSVEELVITGLGVADLRKMLDQARARRVLVTLDCCYSGAAGETLTRDTVGERLRRIEETFGGGDGVYVLSASGEMQMAQESKTLGTGIFTHHLAEGIRSGAADRDGDGLITVSEIAEYLQREVPRDASGQRPHLWADKVSGTFIVAENNALVLKRKAVAFEETVRDLLTKRAIGISFAAGIERWLTSDAAPGNPNDPRWRLLDQIAADRMAGADFQIAWNELDQADEEAEEEAASDAQSRGSSATAKLEPDTERAKLEPETNRPNPQKGRASVAVESKSFWASSTISFYLQLAGITVFLFITAMSGKLIQGEWGPPTHADEVGTFYQDFGRYFGAGAYLLGLWIAYVFVAIVSLRQLWATERGRVPRWLQIVVSLFGLSLLSTLPLLFNAGHAMIVNILP